MKYSGSNYYSLRQKKMYLFFVLMSSSFIHAQTLTILGTLQDGGSPHFGCDNNCCIESKPNDFVSSLGVYDDSFNVIIDATPDFESQHRFLTNKSQNANFSLFLTHAHIGHYSGLMFLGREVANTKNVPVYAMPRMKSFIEQNGPWSQLVSLGNIHLNEIQGNYPVQISNSITIIPFLVPHRDEFSETVGYEIHGRSKSALYIPDIDKWDLWDYNIVSMIHKHDYIFIDGTFYEDGEIPRPMSEVPHPFIVESVRLFKTLTYEQKRKIHFIHLNHSNPARDKNFIGRKELEKLGFQFAEFGDEFKL